jgi:hypothetical protein
MGMTGRVSPTGGAGRQNRVQHDDAIDDASKDQTKKNAIGMDCSDLKRYVSFYFTNFPAELPRFYLRKGFEVCGMLEDVYVAKKRNIHGAPYGFVKFSNVRDVSKLTKALNAVCFGQFRVSARVARFDRTDGQLVSLETGGEKKAARDIVRTSGDQKSGKSEVKPGDGIRVGDVMVPIGVNREKVDCTGLTLCTYASIGRSRTTWSGHVLV